MCIFSFFLGNIYYVRLAMRQIIYDSLSQTIGNTPLVRLKHLTNGMDCEVLVKIEGSNPLSSVKDRIAKAMVDKAEADGLLKAGSTIVEPTSGNTGIALAFIAKSRGYNCVLTMPESMSQERRVLLAFLGAKLILTPGAKGMGGAIAKAREIVTSLGEKGWMASQFDNPANPQVHRETTALEIIEATEGQVDAFIAGVGTGGTLSGVGSVLKERFGTQVIAVEPVESPVISGGAPGPHKIQGIGAGFIPGNLQTELIDEVVTVTSQEALETARALGAKEGLPVGISSGGNVAAALRLAQRREMAGKRIVTVAPSAVERYISTPLLESLREQVANLPVEDI